MDRSTSSYATEDMTLLATNFFPGPWDVICARGKEVYEAPGNTKFRALVREQVQNFSSAQTKTEKGKVVSLIVDTIRKNTSNGGGFVKCVEGRWYEVGSRNAREKVGQAFRDLLHNRYSSSTKAKARLRRQLKKQREAWQRQQRQFGAANSLSLANEQGRFSIHRNNQTNETSHWSFGLGQQTQQQRPTSPTILGDVQDSDGMIDASAEFMSQIDSSDDDCLSQIMAGVFQSAEPHETPVTPPRTTKLYPHGEESRSQTVATVTPPPPARSRVDLEQIGASAVDLEPLPLEVGRRVEWNRASLVYKATLVSFSEAMNDLYQCVPGEH